MKIVVTAGPTREYLDPVRFLSNPSTGKMGFAVAAEAARRGHDVTLIAGPVALKTPPGVRRVDVVSAREMLEKSLESLEVWRFGSLKKIPNAPTPQRPNIQTPKHPNTQTVFVSTAAVADWRPATCAAQKLKKREMSSTLKLVRNPDILKTISQRSKRPDVPSPKLPNHQTTKPPNHQTPQRPNLLLVGFAAETNDVLAEAARKCREKGLAFIVANDVTEAGSGFGTATDRVTFVYPDGRQEKFPLMTKRRVAAALVRAVERLSAADGRHVVAGRTVWATPVALPAQPRKVPCASDGVRTGT